VIWSIYEVSKHNIKYCLFAYHWSSGANNQANQYIVPNNPSRPKKEICTSQGQCQPIMLLSASGA